MDQITNDEKWRRVASALARGLLVVDSRDEIVWMDEKTRRSINGGLPEFSLPSTENEPGIPCFVSTMDIVLEGERRTVCVLRESGDPKEVGHDLVAAVEAIMSDTSWLTRTMIEKLKAWRQAKQASARSSDLDLLTEREREILALICEGRSDAEMGRTLKLSQNTVRNHVASLYRKIGVNRRSAAIIWARERAITSHEFQAPRGRRRVNHESDR
ncbi:MAG TPA: response regulator transcription factor [Methylovirgula sp.]|nr:response regulator transcription factor [Methylovirgula sp.]